MAKSKIAYICENCGHEEPKWTGKCPSCGEWNSFVEKQIAKSISKGISRSGNISLTPKNIFEIETSEDDRIQTGFEEFDRVLGGGFVSEEIILLSGDPGVGKSTLLLQIAAILSDSQSILYVSGEESEKQIALRAKRIVGQDTGAKLSFISTGSMDAIEQAVEDTKPDILLVDSIQTVFDDNLTTIPGGMSQVRASTSRLVNLGKTKGVIIVIVGHINKEGKIAGPKVLEHLVDCVLHFEGHKNGEFRIIRSLKNRFGPAGEVGIFEMAADGIKDFDYSKNLLSNFEEKFEIGVAKAMVVEGKRPIVLDIQALASNSVFPYPKRVSEGVSTSKFQVLSAIVQNTRMGNLADKDLYLKTSGGYSIKNYSYADLSIAAAIISSAVGKPLDQNIVFIGEISLSGKIFAPEYLARYAKEVLKIFPGIKIACPSSMGLRPSKNILLVNKVSDISGLIKK